MTVRTIYGTATLDRAKGFFSFYYHSERVSKAVFPQIAQQILQKPVVDLRSSSRAWKVNLIGEGADDAGGVFDETMAQMCEVRQSSVS